MLTSTIERLKVKLANFKVKYHEEPKIIVVNPKSIIAAKQKEFDMLALSSLLTYKSNRVAENDFEIY